MLRAMRYTERILQIMNRLLMVVWFGLCSILAYYSFFRPGHPLIQSAVGGIIFAIWCVYLIQRRKKSDREVDE